MNRIAKLLEIKIPVIQAGMIWCSPWQLAAAVSNRGGLGIIGAGSMYPDILAKQIDNCRKATQAPFGVNLPLLYPDIEQHIAIILAKKVPVVFTSAGNPKKYTGMLKEKGVKVVHVVSSAKFARKAEEAGVDAVVAEGFEAGGHNGREETTTLCLIPLVKKAVNIPVIAAGGIGTGRSMLAVMALGAEGVQIGSRFVASEESSAHLAFKTAVTEAGEGDTELTLKELTPVRLLKNNFYRELQDIYHRCPSPDELAKVLGRGRAKKGMYEGDLVNGELEIGQISAQVDKILPAAEIIDEILLEYNDVRKQLFSNNFDF